MTTQKTNQTVAKKLSRTRWRAFIVLCVEQLWQLMAPFFTIVAVFLAVVWFGVFYQLGYWGHFGLLGLFGVGAVVALARLRHFCLPSTVAVDQQIEKATGLHFQPIKSQNDRLAGGENDPNTIALWQEHQRRMALALGKLKAGFPAPSMPQRDPYAIRSLVVLVACVGFIFSFGKNGGSFGDIFHFSSPVDTSLMRVDGWVTPPAYTRKAPIYLANVQQSQPESITVPYGSTLTLRMSNGDDAKAWQTKTSGEKLSLAAEQTEDATRQSSLFAVTLQDTCQVGLQARHYESKWNFNVVVDNAPVIELSDDEPGRGLNGSLDLNYHVDDDYGVVKAWVEITPLIAQDANREALYDAPKINLFLPRSGKGKAKTAYDIAHHPWAGSQVQLTLVAQDGAGNIGRSRSYTMVLPERGFVNPLARALVEQRRLLAVNMRSREHVLDMLSALLLRADETINDTKTILVMQSAWTRLSLTKSRDGLRDVADYLWQIAAGVEKDFFGDAEKRLKQAQAALRDALRHGASDDEIERLMQNLRQAMQDYMREFALKAQRGEMPKKPPANTKTLSQDELNEMLKKLEALAKTGDKAAAEKLLSLLEQMMNNLQYSQGQKTGDGEGDAMQKQMDRLGDMMRRQQETLNETHKLHNNSENDADSSARSQKTDELQQRQQDLESDLEQLQKDLQSQGFASPDGMKEAQKFMQESQKFLGEGGADQSAQEQSKALDAMRKGGQKLMQDMKQAMKGKKGSGTKDPLGRERGSKSVDSGDENTIPNESDLQQARRILDEIRKRLGQTETQKLEQQYLERLLKFD